MSTIDRRTNSIRTFVRSALVLSLPAFALSGCYVIPVGPDGGPVYAIPAPAPMNATPHVPRYASSMPPPPSVSVAAPLPVAGAAPPAALPVRLYPANDLAHQTGVLTGTVTNMMTGKGRFQFDYSGELLAGEATRVSGEERRGVASAYGPRGTYASCDYQMNTPLQGAGTCTFSNGAKYQVHIGG
jgi:hypothetical protein